jgi:hypothetical protein
LQSRPQSARPAPVHRPASRRRRDPTALSSRYAGLKVREWVTSFEKGRVPASNVHRNYARRIKFLRYNYNTAKSKNPHKYFQKGAWQYDK